MDYWILSLEALEWIAETVSRIDKGENTTIIAKNLRKSMAIEDSAAVLEMAILRIRGRNKFPEADKMLFTKVGLEQATRFAIARYKSSLIPPNVRIMDGCCGIGGDLIALAENREATGVELNSLTAAIARHNLNVCNRSSKVIVGDVLQQNPADYDFLHIDPDRRSSHSRTVNVNSYSPPWFQLEEWIGDRAAAIKLAPAANMVQTAIDNVHREFIGFDRECREQIAYMNYPSRKKGFRSVTVISPDGSFESLEQPSGIDSTQPIEQGELTAGTWMIEPHAAVFAADMVDELALSIQAHRPFTGSPYLVSSRQPLPTSLASIFFVQATGALDAKQLRGITRELGVRIVEWKHRGIPPATLETIRKKTGNLEHGSVASTLIVYRFQKKIRYAIARRA